MPDPYSPAALARADERRWDTEPDEPRATPCAALFHDRCDGWAWIPAPDLEVPCDCDCHKEDG